ncbi:MAG: helix-turn-helix domain-containing protein [Elainella sp.]
MPNSQIRLIHARTAQPFPAAPDESVQFSSANNGWRGILVEQHEMTAMEFPEHYVQGHRLIVQTGQPVSYEWRQGSRWQTTTLQPGMFCLQSHGELNLPRWHGRFEFLAIALEPEFLEQGFRVSDPGAIRFRERRGGFDPVISQFAARFRSEIQSGSYCGVLYGESLALAFSRYLLEQHSHSSQLISTERGQLSPRQLQEIIDLIHTDLPTELSLTDLAKHLNLSPFHFARLFKHSLGLSPHQYVLQNRIERAKKLIATTPKLSLTEIGLQVGFYDQTHFGKAFKRTVGLSPKQFAKQM